MVSETKWGSPGSLDIFKGFSLYYNLQSERFNTMENDQVVYPSTLNRAVASRKKWSGHKSSVHNVDEDVVSRVQTRGQTAFFSLSLGREKKTVRIPRSDTSQV